MTAWLDLNTATQAIGQSRDQVLYLCASDQFETRYLPDENRLEISQRSVEVWLGHPVVVNQVEQAA